VGNLPRGTMTKAGAKIAILNSNEDTVEMLRIHLEAAGMVTVGGHVPDIKRGKLDLQEFVGRHRPAVVVWDIGPPYEENWTFFNLVRTTDAARQVRFVLTTTNRDRLVKVCGDCDPIEIVGKPYDLDQVKKAVENALRGSARKA
jgi:DNA-binding NarL/FixJ family response regulator